MPFLSPSFDLRTTLVSVSVSVSGSVRTSKISRTSWIQGMVRNLYLGFVALVVLPNEFAAVHTALVRVAHVVVGSGMLRVQTLPEQVIFYFYCFVSDSISRITSARALRFL